MRGYVPALDGLRAMAVWLVVLYHIGIPGIPGAYGVELFFVLSGYLITSILWHDEVASGTLDYRRFLRRRARRIAPPYYVFLAVTVLWKLWRDHPVAWGHLASAATFTSNWYNAYLGDPNSGFSHTWSLAIEVQFYCLWPVVLLTMRRRASNVRPMLLAGIGGLWVVRALLLGLTALPQAYYYAAFEMRLDAFLVGAWLALYQAEHPGTLSRVMQQAGVRRIFGCALVAAAALAWGESRWGVSFRDGVTATLLPLVCAGLIGAALACEAHGALRWLRSAPVVWLGRLSYSTYLYQQLVPGLGAKFDAVLPPGEWRVPSQHLVEIAVVLCLAIGSYYGIEQPAARLRRQRPVPSPEMT